MRSAASPTTLRVDGPGRGPTDYRQRQDAFPNLSPQSIESSVTLQTQITDDLKTAMKARDRDRMAALRLLLASMKNAAVDAGRGPQGDLDDDEVVRLVQTEVKRRREAADAFRDGGREESAAKEEQEAEVYGAYLPEQLDDDKLEDIVDRAIATSGATDRSGMGTVMKAVMVRVGGRADGKRVSGMVGRKLS